MQIERHEFEEYKKRMSEEHDRQNARIKDMEKDFHEIRGIALSVEKLALNMQHMLEELQRQNKVQEKQEARLEELEDRDGEKWRNLIKYVGTTIVGILLGYIFTQLGLK